LGFLGEFQNRHPHNYFITVFFRLGLLGILAYSFMLIRVIKNAINAIKNYSLYKGYSEYRDGVIILLSVFIASLFNSCFDVYLENPYGAIIFWSILGTLVYWINFFKINVKPNHYGFIQ
jgi:O-antigen ligase